MLRLMQLLLALAGIVVIVILAVANREPVAISFWPLNYGLTLPLFAVALACFILGVLVAGLVGWLANWRTRAQAYRDHRRVIALEARDRLKEEQTDEAELQRQRDRRARFALAGERG